MKKIKHRLNSDGRLCFIYALMIVISIMVIINVFMVTIGKVHVRSNTKLDSYVTTVSQVNEPIYASRGNIYDANGVVVAQDVKTYDIICYIDENRLGIGNKPAYVDNPLYTARMLAPILGMQESEIYEYLTSNPNLYQTELGPMGRNLSEEQVEQIKAIEDLNGIDFRTSYLRNYNLGESFAPYLIGYAQSDDTGKLVGKMGLESYLNEELSGVDGLRTYQQDKNGYTLPGMKEETVEAVNGYDVYVTLDASIQAALDDCLTRLGTEKLASKSWGAVVEVGSGKILAWGQTPSFNPNVLEFSEHLNYGSQVAFEPGSTMKPIIYAAAMDLGVYDGNTNYDSSPFCVTGTIDEPTRTYNEYSAYACINNVDNKNWGYIPLDYGLIYSSNVATSTLLCGYVGFDNYLNYLNKFHIYTSKAVNSDGIEENVGYSNYGLSPVDDLTATYGQGSTVNMLQLLQAYTAIFGNGEMIKPYYIDKIVDPNTNTLIYEGQREVVSTPISENSAKRMQELLRRVVTDKEGTARHYAIEGVDIIAKTGTADIVSGGEYVDDVVINSVMLAFPYEKPEYMVYIAYESTTSVYYNYDKKPIPDLVKKIAVLEGLNINTEESIGVNTIEKMSMKDYTNMNISEAILDLDNKGLEVIKIGDGNKVIRQVPNVNDDVYTKQRVFLLTDGNNISLPDFTGWTRKEIINYWNLSGLSIVIEGYGITYEQSIPAYSLVNKSDQITVKLQNINYVEPQENDLEVKE